VLLLSACLFAITFLIAFALVSRSSPASDAVINRVQEPRRREYATPKPAVAWRALVARLGSAERGSKRDKLRASFIRAGIRSESAGNVFAGLKSVAAVCGGLGAAALMALQGAESPRIVIGVLVGAAGGYILPDELLKLKIRRRKAKIEKALPNTLDLLTICVEAGLGLDQAMVHVAGELASSYPDISDELAMITLELRAGKRRADCLRAFGERTGVQEVKKLAAVLIQADRFGTSIAQSLRIHSEHLRTERRQAAEEKAAKLGVKLVFPIFFFILPSLFVVTVGPVIVRIIEELIPLMNSM
jgi:tight adherence protein C